MSTFSTAFTAVNKQTPVHPARAISSPETLSNSTDNHVRNNDRQMSHAAQSTGKPKPRAKVPRSSTTGCDRTAAAVTANPSSKRRKTDEISGAFEDFKVKKVRNGNERNEVLEDKAMDNVEVRPGYNVQMADVAQRGKAKLNAFRFESGGQETNISSTETYAAMISTTRIDTGETFSTAGLGSTINNAASVGPRPDQRDVRQSAATSNIFGKQVSSSSPTQQWIEDRLPPIQNEQMEEDIPDESLFDTFTTYDMLGNSTPTLPRNSGIVASEPSPMTTAEDVDMPVPADPVFDDDWIENDSDIAMLTDIADSLTAMSSPITRQSPCAGGTVKTNLIVPPVQSFTPPTSDAVLSPQTPTENASTKPIVRPPFPSPVIDRSPIVGLTPNIVLRVCFRVGEAFNTGCAAVRNNTNVIIELYARVVSTTRDNEAGKQTFTLADLYHNRPPLLNAVYEGWKGQSPCDYDAAVFLEERPGDENAKRERMCRVVGKMCRVKNEWVFNIMSIWEAGWEDVEFVRGIVCA